MHSIKLPKVRFIRAVFKVLAEIFLTPYIEPFPNFELLVNKNKENIGEMTKSFLQIPNIPNLKEDPNYYLSFVNG